MRVRFYGEGQGGSVDGPLISSTPTWLLDWRNKLGGIALAKGCGVS